MLLPMIFLSFPILIAILWFVDEVEEGYHWLDREFPGGALAAILVFLVVVFMVVLLAPARKPGDGPAKSEGG